MSRWLAEAIKLTHLGHLWTYTIHKWCKTLKCFLNQTYFAYCHHCDQLPCVRDPLDSMAQDEYFKRIENCQVILLVIFRKLHTGCNRKGYLTEFYFMLPLIGSSSSYFKILFLHLANFTVGSDVEAKYKDKGNKSWKKRICYNTDNEQWLIHDSINMYVNM